MDECTLTSADLDLPTYLMELLERAEWECSRPVWKERDDVDDRCIWHADTTDKPPAELEDAVDGADLYGALIPRTAPQQSLFVPPFRLS